MLQYALSPTNKHMISLQKPTEGHFTLHDFVTKKQDKIYTLLI